MKEFQSESACPSTWQNNSIRSPEGGGGVLGLLPAQVGLGLQYDLSIISSKCSLGVTLHCVGRACLMSDVFSSNTPFTSSTVSSDVQNDYAEWTHWKKCVGLQWGTKIRYITLNDFCKIIRTQSSTIWCHMLVKDLIHNFGFLTETKNRGFRPSVEGMSLDPDISGVLGEHVCVCLWVHAYVCVYVCVEAVRERVLPLE